MLMYIPFGFLACLPRFLNLTFVSRFGYMSRAHDNRLDQRPLIKQLTTVLERSENTVFYVQDVISIFIALEDTNLQKIKLG